MKILQATELDLPMVEGITQKTIRAIYPKYYPPGATELFLSYHSAENILRDILEKRVYLLFVEEQFVGTVTIKKNEISRLFVLPDFQHRGAGRALLDFAEDLILASYDTVTIAASFPAKQIYKKRGYAEISYNTLKAENGDFLCFDVMEKGR